MVALAIQGNTFVNVSAKGRLYSSRMDIPIPSNELDLQKLDLKENERTVSLEANDSSMQRTVSLKANDSSMQQYTIFDMGNREVESADTVKLGIYKSTPAMKVLRWSFSDVINACAKTQNSGLAEQLILQVRHSLWSF